MLIDILLNSYGGWFLTPKSWGSLFSRVSRREQGFFLVRVVLQNQDCEIGDSLKKSI